MTGTTTDRRRGVTGSAAIKVPCKAATTAAITLSGEQTIDGVAITSGDRVLVKDQSTGSQNGIYLASTGSWSRAPDFDGTNDVLKGTTVYVHSGATNSGYWYVSTSDPITPGSTSISITRASSVLATVAAAAQALLDDTTTTAMRETLEVPHRYWPRNLVVNGHFGEWTNKPSAGYVDSPGVSLGFNANTIADNWYGGPGTGGTYRFSTPAFANGQTDVAGAPRVYCQLEWTGGVTDGWSEYTGVERATYLEQNGNEPPEAAVGEVWTMSFDARVASGTMSVVPVLWISLGVLGWLTGQTKTSGTDYVTYGDYIYLAASSGTTGSTAPTHTSGTVSDGGVDWLFVGKSKGRAYDIYEGGPNAATGTPYAAVGTPNTGAAVTVTTTWQRFEVTIALPDLGYNNTTDYATTGDTPRALVPIVERLDLGGSRPYLGVGFDIVGLPNGGDILRIANVKCEMGANGTPFELPPRRLNRFLSSEPSLWSIRETNVIQGWATVNVSSGVPSIGASLNVSGLTDDGVGKCTVSWTHDFGTANYAVAATAQTNNSLSAPSSVNVGHASKVAGSVQLLMTDNGTTAAFADPPSFSVMAAGTRAAGV
jgi:hypothetical protein